MPKPRWACTLCECVCEKRPYFKPLVQDHYVPPFVPKQAQLARLKAITEGYDIGTDWCCVECYHPTRNHRFTWMKPGENTDFKRFSSGAQND